MPDLVCQAQTSITFLLVLQVPEYIAQLTASINHAVTILQKGAAASGDTSVGANVPVDEHVYTIMLVKGRPYYGYAPREKYFLKVHV